MTIPGATNVAAVAALVQEADALANGGHRSSLSRVGGNVVSSSLGGLPRGTSSMAVALAASGTNGRTGSLPLPSPPASLPSRKFLTADGSAIDDDLNDMSDGDVEPASLSDASAIALELAQARRASDGQSLLREGRRSSRMELRCKQCGKGYKHSSCLTKHLWEHTPEWALTSKLLISKHQQVQLLEAASVLVNMNVNLSDAELDANVAVTPPDSTRDSASDDGSVSPPPTFAYEHQIRDSIDTTPPPPSEEAMNVDNNKTEGSALYPSPPQASVRGYSSFSQRVSQAGGAASFARSYQASLSEGKGVASLGNIVRRRSSAGKNATGQEDHELAAAVELLSCSFNSGAGEANTVTSNSLRGFGHPASPLGDTSFINSFPSRAPESFTRGDHRRSSLADDVKMDRSGDSIMDDEEDTRSRARSDDDDDGVFGRMEE
ncbi:hypothetical protein SEPCBS119000_001814 [Sporothrix epigloea]|uniref:C2H2-type domain-containing protein n=1 Tax=Sporothrix epigloea TaxID=1892477 RepID=A0ABP0DDZ9_9PEZI